MILFLLYFIRIFKLCCFTCDNISLGTRKQKHGNFRTAQIFNIDQYPVFNVDSFFLHLYSRTLISIYILDVGHSSFLTSIKTKQKKIVHFQITVTSSAQMHTMHTITIYFNSTLPAFVALSTTSCSRLVSLSNWNGIVERPDFLHQIWKGGHHSVSLTLMKPKSWFNYHTHKQ